MFRSLLPGAFIAGLILTVGLPATPAQEKKDPPKKKERIALSDPKDVAKDPDFAIQGEYVGEITLNEGKRPIGVQVIAKGLGEFDVKILMGGLPGDGWDGKDAKMVTAKRGDDGTATIAGLNMTGSIGDGKLKLKDGLKIDTALTKVERKSNTLGKKPPEGAMVLFGKEGDEKNWDGGKITELSDGKFLNIGIKSKEKFGAFKTHVEFRLPWMPNSTEQGRGNSGVYLQDRYEVQVLDSFGLKGENNECGGIYTQHKPLVNMCFPPMAWQTYDIEFTPAEFEGDKRVKPARATIYHNGVKIHDNVEMKGPTGGGQPENANPGPIQLQNHNDPLVYRNIWVVPVK